MAQRLRLASTRGIAVLHRIAGWIRHLQGPALRPVLLHPEEERPRPRRSGDPSRDGGKRAVARALPGEAVIEHQHLINATVPLASAGFRAAVPGELVSWPYQSPLGPVRSAGGGAAAPGAN